MNLSDKVNIYYEYVKTSKMTAGSEYIVTLEYNGEAESFTYHTGASDEVKTKDVLYCLLRDRGVALSCKSIKSVQDTFGYNREYARRVYFGCRENSKRLRNLFNIKELKMLDKELGDY